VRYVAADLMRIRDAALADKLLETIVMDPRRGLGRDANVADKTEPVEQRPHVVRLWRGRGILQPAKGRCLERRIGDEQHIELGELRRGEACEQSISGALARPGPPRDGGALDYRGRRKNDPRCAQGSDHPGNDRLAAIRAPGGLRRGLDHEGQIGVARRPQAKRPGKEERMVRHGLRPVGVIGEGGGRNIQLRRQPLDKGVDRLLHLRQAYAGMAQQGQLHGKAQAMAAPRRPATRS
jgi:hypothetical protein